MNPTISRKEISSAAGVSDDTVRRRQKEWGLDKCRAHGTKIPVTFWRDKANRVLLKKGVIERPI